MKYFDSNGVWYESREYYEDGKTLKSKMYYDSDKTKVWDLYCLDGRTLYKRYTYFSNGRVYKETEYYWWEGSRKPYEIKIYRENGSLYSVSRFSLSGERIYYKRYY